MKKTITILCCMFLCISLAACGQDASGTSSPTDTSKQDSAYFDELGMATSEAFEIVYNEAEIISYRNNYAYIFIFVGIKNVSNAPILVNPINAYQLSKADGTVIEENYFDFYSPIIAEPGEVFYLYDYTTTDKVQPGDQLTCSLDDRSRSYRAGENDYHFYQVSDLQLSLSEDGDRMNLTGTLHCDEIAEGKNITMTCIGFDKSGKPVCCFAQILYSPEPGSNVEFTMIAEVYGSVVPEDLDDNFKVYAYSSVE